MAKAKAEATRAAREARQVLLRAKEAGHFDHAANAEAIRKRAEDLLAGQYQVDVRLSPGALETKGLRYFTDPHGRVIREARSDVTFTLRLYALPAGPRVDVFDFELMHEASHEPEEWR